MTNETQVGVPSLPNQTASEEDIIIRTKDLTKRFGSEVAVEDVTFNVPRGSIFGFIGPSGSGKTTTIRMLNGFYAPTSGEVTVFDRSPVNFTQGIRARIGYMPQLFVYYPNLSIWENLNFAASIYGMSWFRKKKLNEVLDFVELGDHKKKLARNISGGMQRRLSLAATLVHDPELIFLDEPTAGIDPVLRNKIWDRFRDLRANERTLFVTTQYVSEAAYCDLVGVMGGGRLLVVDTPQGLRYHAYGGDMVDLRLAEPFGREVTSILQQLPEVKGDIIRTSANSVRITVNEASTAVPTLLDWARDQGLNVESIEEYQPPFDDVFVQIVSKMGRNGGESE